MKIFVILACMLLMIPAACTTATEPAAVSIAHHDPASGAISQFRKDWIRPAFADGIPISEARIDRDGARFYLLLKGQRAEPAAAGQTSCRTQRIQLTPRGDALMLARSAGTETCTGVHCQHCEFASGGGCVCKEASPDVKGQAAGICNHSISRLSGYSSVLLEGVHESARR